MIQESPEQRYFCLGGQDKRYRILFVSCCRDGWFFGSLNMFLLLLGQLLKIFDFVESYLVVLKKRVFLEGDLGGVEEIESQ